MTSSNTPSIAEIAAGLTENQRRAILSARWIGSSLSQMCLVDYTDPWAAPIAVFLTLRTDRLNSTGLAVRDHLLKEQDQ
jgi:hypothetical protein